MLDIWKIYVIYYLLRNIKYTSIKYKKNVLNYILEYIKYISILFSYSDVYRGEVTFQFCLISHFLKY